MPELPEVETIKRGLEKSIIGKTIADFDCDWNKMINLPLAKYRKQVTGKQVTGIKRRAKMLIIDLSGDWKLLIHLKMTGQLVFKSKAKCVIGGHPITDGYKCLPNRFTHATFAFTDGSHLYYNDVRKFGWVRLFISQELEKIVTAMALGPEPLEAGFNLSYLRERIKKRTNTKIKQFLMDNSNIVGIGNIYSDEICFYAKVRPERNVKTLTDKEIKLIYKGIRYILPLAIKHEGTSISDYVNSQGEAGGFTRLLKIYGRYGEKCLACKTLVKRWKMGGRSSSYCPNCQK